ncbi:helix-turn-helix domain-containing protein [Agromyces mediolanus]|uniref:ArsR/SmtB family transcription factor n=1 Tax=Agromyces mediolanus TaxID=41986 RepID=UPI00203B7282|nr:helix-turn-helix domain-containing protein [Agromyces mediolanus]MCM3655924.1 helix-turn-helix domain-containing protein [Agromyces mediolanus]
MTDHDRHEPSRIELHDLGRMRALANPARMRVLGLLRLDGPATVGRLSERLDEAPGSVSYHLQTLAKHGFVEEAPELARDRRERWWRSAHDYTSWDPLEFRDDPATRAGLDEFRRQVLEGYHRELLDALAAEPALEADWVEASESADAAAHLTAAELRELSAELAAVRERWRGRGRERRDGTRPVRFITHTFVRSEP